MRRPWPLLLFLAACGTQDLGGTEALRLTASNPPPAYLGEVYGFAFSAEGGVRPYAFSLEGRLPEGLAFQGGRLSGTPKEKGQFPLILTVEDAAKNSRAQKLTLTVGDPPPPRLALVLPPAQVEGPFLLLARLEAREALGFQLELPLPDLAPALESLKAASPAYLLDYDGEKRLLRLDLAFAKPLKDLEAFRLLLTPGKPLTPRLTPKVVFYDKEGKPLGQPFPRKGRFEDLLKLAQNWGKKGEGLPGDLDGDKEVGPKDLEKLKEGYFPPQAPKEETGTP